MKKFRFMDISDIILIPLITYLVTGLIIISLCNLPVNTTYYVVWGVMAGIILGIWKYFSKKAVTLGICAYAAAIFLWLLLFEKSGGLMYAVLICISFASILLLMKLMQKRIVKALSGCIIMAFLICLSIADIQFSKFLVAMAVVLFLNSVAELIACFYSGNVKSLTIIYIMVALFTVSMPVSEEPYGWNFVFKIAAFIEDNFSHFNHIGYSDSEMDLSSGLKEQDVEQLVIKGKRTRRNMYLKGNVLSEYVGNTWTTDLENDDIDYRIDTLMTLYAIFQETEEPGELNRFMEVKEQEVTFKDIKTKSVFYPLKILDISVENLDNSGDVLGLTKENTNGYSYKYHFVDIDYANSKIIEILKKSQNITYEEEAYNRIYTHLKDWYGIELEPLGFDEFCEMAEKYRNQTAEQYINVGSKVSENVVRLTDETAQGSQNDYESCKKLEKYLSRYEYSRDIQAPEGVDMLDWFLFESKEGYCAHYATALAVMLRCEEIPSRVAEGFLVDYGKYLDRDTYSVSSAKGHVWAEAYIDGFGWIRLEPTSVNNINADTPWYSDAAQSENAQIEEAKDPEEEITNATQQAQKTKEQQKNLLILMAALLCGLAVIVIIILVVLFISQKISVRKSRNPDIVCGYMISVLGKKYFPKKDSETLSEYFDNLKKCEDVDESMRAELSEIQEFMENYWYGNASVTKEQIDKMKGVKALQKGRD